MVSPEYWPSDGIAWRQNDAMDARHRHVLVVGQPQHRALIQRIWHACAETPFDWIGLSPWLDRDTDHHPFPLSDPRFHWALSRVLGPYQHAAVAVIDGEPPKLPPEVPVVSVDSSDEAAAIDALSRLIIQAPPPDVQPQWVREPAEWVNLSFDRTVGEFSRVLLIGDSISNGYGNRLRARMDGRRAVDQLQLSEGMAGPMLTELVDFMLDARAYGDIHMNIGLHIHEVPPDAYGERLGLLMDHMRSKSRARLTFASTTPVHLGGGQSPLDRTGTDRVIALNQAAEKVCAARGVQWNDLFQLCLKEGLAKVDTVHFAPSANARLTDAVAAIIG